MLPVRCSDTPAFILLKHFAVWSRSRRPLFILGSAFHLVCNRSRNLWPLATAGSTETWQLMKSHPIAVSPDHRGVFAALTGPMRAPIWPRPHEFEWARRWWDPPLFFLTGCMQIVLIRLSEMISTVVSGSEPKWGARVKEGWRDGNVRREGENECDAHHWNLDVLPRWQKSSEIMGALGTTKRCEKLWAAQRRHR